LKEANGIEEMEFLNPGFRSLNGKFLKEGNWENSLIQNPNWNSNETHSQTGVPG